MKVSEVWVFVGRTEQLAALKKLLASTSGPRGEKPGRAILIRGRRRVGKSTLVERFLAETGVPHVFFTASQQDPRRELRLFTQEVAESSLPDADVFADTRPESWDAALRLLATILPRDHPSVVVIDELPYLAASVAGFEGILQKAFDRYLSTRPVLLIGVGSDLSTMEALNAYGRPFHQRATEMVVPPLSPAEVGQLLDLPPAEALDAYLVTGGLPLVCTEWPRGSSLADYLATAVADPTSALLVSGERALAAEFPPEAQTRLVLTAVGSGERTHSGLRAATGLGTNLDRALRVLVQRRIVAADRPLSTRPSRETRYRVADPYLRFWLAFLGPHLAEVERGRGDRVLARVTAGWGSWRGRAIEPVVRESLERLPELTPGAGHVGGFWTRNNDVEVDLVIADRMPVADTVHAVGSVKWHERAPFDGHDLARLAAQRARVPGADADTPLLAVSRAGSTIGPAVRTLGPDELVRAWS